MQFNHHWTCLLELINKEKKTVQEFYRRTLYDDRGLKKNHNERKEIS